MSSVLKQNRLNVLAMIKRQSIDDTCKLSKCSHYEGKSFDIYLKDKSFFYVFFFRSIYNYVSGGTK